MWYCWISLLLQSNNFVLMHLLDSSVTMSQQTSCSASNIIKHMIFDSLFHCEYVSADGIRGSPLTWTNMADIVSLSTWDGVMFEDWIIQRVVLHRHPYSEFLHCDIVCWHLQYGPSSTVGLFTTVQTAVFVLRIALQRVHVFALSDAAKFQLIEVEFYYFFCAWCIRGGHILFLPRSVWWRCHQSRDVIQWI